MRPLTAVERFFERLFERPSARIFRTRLQPVQLQRRIERAMETERLSGADRTLVPNRYRVRLNPEDLVDFGDFSDSLAAELADGALAFARAHRYTLVDRPRVELVADRRVERSEIRVETRFADRAADREPEGDDAVGTEGDQPAVHDTGTAIFTLPDVDVPVARLRIIRRDGTERETQVERGQMTIGRARDNDLVLDDGKVSRHHARLVPRQRTLVFTDLASTNGSWVNGTRVAEVALGEGDRIELGETVLVVESVSGSDD
jgi:hypothetical protein